MPFWEQNWGNVASLAGLIASVVGLVLTYREAHKSKTAAEKAREAVADVKKRLSTLDAVAAIAEAILMMDEIKRLNREHAWNLLPDRCTILKRRLITIRGFVDLTEEDQTALSSGIQHMGDIQNRVEKLLHMGKKKPPDVPRLNRIISVQTDKLSEILNRLKQRCD